MANVTIFPRCHRPENNTNKCQRFQVVLTIRLSRTLILNIVDVSGVHYLLQVDGSNYIRRLLFILRLTAAGGIEPRILSRFTSLTFTWPCIVNVFLSTTNKMRHYTIFFIVVSALHVSSGFSAHLQEIKYCACSIGYLSKLFAATANVGESELQLTYVSGSSKQVSQVSDAACTVFELLMISGKTTRNM